jgi:hypothetical protein
MELLTQLDLAATNDFFKTFFALPGTVNSLVQIKSSNLEYIDPVVGKHCDSQLDLAATNHLFKTFFVLPGIVDALLKLTRLQVCKFAVIPARFAVAAVHGTCCIT